MSHPSSVPAALAAPPAGRALHPSRGHSRRRRAALALVPSSAPGPDTAATADAIGAGASLDETRERPSLRVVDEDGSLVTEYGLIAVVAATVAGVIIQWASGGALVTLFNALLRQARELVGA